MVSAKKTNNIRSTSFFLTVISAFFLLEPQSTAFASDNKGWVTDADTARKVLLDSGYKNIQIGGFSWLSGCPGHWYQTKFSAIGPSGRYVTGTVCSGIITKGAQILIDSN